MRLLLAEDDAALSAQLKAELQRAGFAVDIVCDGVDAQYMGEQEPYDVVVLDLGLPGRSGLDVLRNWRAQGNRVPVVVLTARDAWYEKVDGFKAGADDYLGKPFHTEELLMRIHAVVRRSSTQSVAGLEYGDLRLDEETQSVVVGSQVHALTGMEFRLLRYFMLHRGEVLSKSRLAEHLYEYDQDKDSNVIEVYVRRLREKLGKDSIDTRRGQGYVFGTRP
jgi:DNA-binding response OmpR family regulator